MQEIQDLDQKQGNSYQNNQQFKNSQQQITYNIQPKFQQHSELIQYEQPLIQQLVLNKIETLGKTISQVLAIEMFKQFTTKTRGWSLYLLQNEISEQRRNFLNLQEDSLKNGLQEEWQVAREEFKKFLKMLEDLLQNQEHKQLLQNILQPPPALSFIMIQPDMKFFNALENYHYQSKINFHNSLQLDNTGQDLLEKIKTYKNELAKFLYFKFIEQGIRYLDQLLNYVLIHKIQNNQFTLQLLNDYIRQLRTENDKQQLLNEIQLIIIIFPELAQYFQEIYNIINDELLYFDGRVELQEQQFEIVMLIYDYIVTPIRILNRKLSNKTICVMQQLNWIYRTGSVQTKQKQLKDLKKYIKQNHSQELQLDLDYLSDLFISTKLKLLMKMIQQINVLQDSDIKFEYFNFHAFSFQDQDIIQQCLKQEDGHFLNIYHEPSIDEQQINIQQVFNQFNNVIEFAAHCEMDLNKNAQNNSLEELKNKIKDSIQSLANQITSTKTIIKLQALLNQIFWFQKLNGNTFLVLYQYNQEISEIQLKKQDIIGNEEVVPNLYLLLLNFDQEKDKDILFQKKVKEITELISEDYAVDFSDLIKEIEQFDQKNKAAFIKNAKQYYYKDFKVHLLNLLQYGTKQFQEAINYLIQQVDP
ncbi:unnamed protein product [Paramecium primaurelia]|uniref:Uncharacterized protein n=1 Tax=Paramecium primaurelia TaxID=5886 RepID=A0A8S1Q7T2_PARPR|nr:unnamed protein product [Paramecium primaurelia]